MQRLKTLLKKYYPLAFVLFMASQSDGCTACNQPPKEAPQPVVELVKSPDIKGKEKGKVILKVKGVKWYNDVWLYFKNHQAFAQEEEKALQSPMELHTFLGKANEKIPEEGIEVALPIQASEETIAGNKADATLLMSVGNATNPAAYVSEQEVLTWKKAVPVITVSEVTKITGKNYAEITFTNTGAPVKKSTVLLKWSGDLNKFSFSDNPGNVIGNKTLDKLKNDCTSETMFESNETITLPIYVLPSTTGDTELTLKVSVHNNVDATTYVTEQEVIIWKMPGSKHGMEFFLKRCGIHIRR